MTRTLAEENTCHVKCVQSFKTFDKVSHVYENFVKMFMFFMFEIDLGINIGYFMYSYQFKKEVYDWFDLKGFAVLCMTRELDEWWKTTPDLVPTVHFGIHRITLWNVRPYRTTVFRPVSFLPFNGCNLF